MGLFKKNMDKKMSMQAEDKAPGKSLALAVSLKRKKMSKGGEVAPATPSRKPDDKKIPESESMSKNWSEGSAPARKPDDERRPMDEYMANHFSKGGIVEEVMKRRKMADGGQVDIEENGEEMPADHFDDLNEEAGMKELYDDNQLESQPEDSNMHGHELSDEDANDMISAIRRKMMAKK